MLSALARLLQKEKLGHAARQVPGSLAAPFKAFAQWSLYLDAQRRKPEVKQVSGQSSSAVHLSPAVFCYIIMQVGLVQICHAENYKPA